MKNAIDIELQKRTTKVLDVLKNINLEKKYSNKHEQENLNKIVNYVKINQYLGKEYDKIQEAIDEKSNIKKESPYNNDKDFQKLQISEITDTMFWPNDDARTVYLFKINQALPKEIKDNHEKLIDTFKQEKLDLSIATNMFNENHSSLKKYHIYNEKEVKSALKEISPVIYTDEQANNLISKAKKMSNEISVKYDNIKKDSIPLDNKQTDIYMYLQLRTHNYPKIIVSDIVLQKEVALNPSKPENLLKTEKLFIELKDKLKYNEKIRQYITQNKECLLEKIQEKDKMRPRKQKIVMKFSYKDKSNNRNMSR